MFHRLLNIPKTQSFFLFGPRGVGKSTLLQSSLPADTTHFIDLLDFDLESRLLARPAAFAELVATFPAKITHVVVDEVQKLPFVLNEVHRQIELNPQRQWALTGSSARKLKRGQANLLGGRAFSLSLAPLCREELGDRFDLQEALELGTLPRLYHLSSTKERQMFLRSYAETYLREEIQMEGLLRSLPAFRRFLPLAANANGETLAWSNIAQDVGVDVKTIRSYYEILEDTLVGFMLPAFHRSLRKRQKTHPKFYFFDTGVKRALEGSLTVPLLPRSSDYGKAFEHFCILELQRHNIYRQADFRFSYLGTNDMEIDVLIERPGKPLVFLEIKSAEFVPDRELRALKTLAEEFPDAKALCASREPRARQVGPIKVIPWQDMLCEVGLEK